MCGFLLYPVKKLTNEKNLNLYVNQITICMIYTAINKVYKNCRYDRAYGRYDLGEN